MGLLILLWTFGNNREGMQAEAMARSAAYSRRLTQNPSFQSSISHVSVAPNTENYVTDDESLSVAFH